MHSTKIKPSLNIKKNNYNKIKMLLDYNIFDKKNNINYKFKENDILKFYKIINEKIRKCTGAPNGVQKFYILTGTNVKIPIQLAKEV